MSIGVLGPLNCGGTAAGFGRRDRAVLTALAMCVGEAVSADRLSDAVWGDVPPPSSHKALQGCVVRLRKALGADAIETSAQGYSLLLPAEEIDSQRFERMVTRSRELLALGEPERATYMLEQALDLWRGRAFEEIESWDQAVAEASRLEELRLEAEELRVEACLRTGRHLAVLADAEGMVRAAPMRERRWNLLALAQYQAGRQTEALRTIHRIKSLLANQVGLDPGPELEALEEAMLRHDPSLIAEGLLPTSGRCPYRGLRPYDIDDSESFFGRDDDVQACLNVLNTCNLLAVMGPSGCGKSSLVRAGVAAALRRDARPFVVITPGEHPMQSLAAASDPGPRSVLLVDQAEEAFSLCDDEVERQAFFAALVEWAEHRPLVLAMRADRLAELAAYPGFARLVERGLHLLGAMSEDGLRDAVEAPARQSGLLIEAGLVDLLVGEVEGAPGALPMLSHALMETWNRREGNALTVAGYAASGGIRGAVAQSAERVYASVDPGQRPLLRDLLLRLVTARSEGAPVRGRVPRRLLSTDPDHARLIDMLVASRLVTSDSGVVEIAHEALARAWPRLRAWLDDDVEGQRILHHLTGAADSWDSMGRPDSELYRGPRATQALQWKDRRGTTLTATEVAFLDATARREQSEQRAATVRARAQARLILRLRGVLAGAAVLLVAVLISGGLALDQKQRAEDNAATAVAAQTSSEARHAGVRALIEDDVTMSMLLAVAGVRLDDSPETRSSLLAALGEHPELIASTQTDGASIISVDVSPDGRRLATYDLANHARLYDISTGDLLAEFQAGAPTPLSWVTGRALFSPNGRTLAVVMAAPTHQPVMLLDARTLEPLPGQPLGLTNKRWQLLNLDFSGDGRWLVASLWQMQGRQSALRSTSTWVVVWDLERPQRWTKRIRLPDDHAVGVGLSSDGQVLYLADPDALTDTQATGTRLTISSLSSGDTTRVRIPGYVSRFAVSPNGRLLAGVAGDTLLLIDAATGAVQREIPGVGGAFYVTFSADGRLVGSMTWRGQALVWDVVTGRLTARLPVGWTSDVVDFSPDGSTLYTGFGTTVQRWDLEGDHRFIAQVGATPVGGFGATELAPRGDYVAYPRDALTFFNTASGTLGEHLERHTGYSSARGSWHPDGVHYALASGGVVQVWNARTDELTMGRRPSGRNITSTDYSADGSRLVIGELSGQVTMLDAATLEPVGQPVRLEDAVCCVAAGPDNRTALVLTGYYDPSGVRIGASTRWSLVDLESGTVVHEGDLGFNGVAPAMSPDGANAAIGGHDGELLLVDTVTGEPLTAPVVGRDRIFTLTYSADGTRVLTSAGDGSVSLLDALTGEQLARLVSPMPIAVAEFGEDPNTIRIAAWDSGPIYEWDPRISTAVDFACEVAGRDLTEAEWHETFGDRPYEETCPSA